MSEIIQILAPKAPPELIEKVAKKLALTEVYHRAEGRVQILAKEAGEQRDEFIKNYKQLLEDCWNGTEESDIEERKHFTHLAIAALIATGYEVDIEDQVLKAILV